MTFRYVVKEVALADGVRASFMPKPFAEHPGIFGDGGGKVGALVLSPLVEPGKKNNHPFNHYSLLRSVEDMFQLDHLGFAQPTDLKTFQECDVFKADES